MQKKLKQKYDPMKERLGSIRTVRSLSHTSALVATCNDRGAVTKVKAG
jgi:hypothetical protein